MQPNNAMKVTPGLITRYPQEQIRQADEVNRMPLPAIPDRFGVRLPPFEYQTTLPNLQWGAEEEPARETDKPSAVSGSPLPHNMGIVHTVRLVIVATLTPADSCKGFLFTSHAYFAYCARASSLWVFPMCALPSL